MDLFCAIDIRAGQCVRLAQGDYAAETIYDEDPVSVACRFAAEGATWIHLVDLDAARTGRPENRAVIGRVAAAVGGVRVQAGGGIRDRAAAEAAWAAGVERVVVGTAAVTRPELVAELAAVKPDGVAVGLDSRAGVVAVRGWTEGSDLRVVDLLTGLAGRGAVAVVLTDIARDGMLVGPDVAGLTEALTAAPAGIEVVASGGVSGRADLEVLASLRGRDGRALAGVIVGKALYEGRLTVSEGIEACAAFA